MRLKTFALPLIAGITATVLFWAGYTIGINRMTRCELDVTVPFHVKIYQYIRDGDTNQAATLTAMALMGKIGRYDEVRGDWLFSATAGRAPLHSPRLQKYCSDARAIIKIETTNIFTVRTSLEIEKQHK